LGKGIGDLVGKQFKEEGEGLLSRAAGRSQAWSQEKKVFYGGEKKPSITRPLRVLR